jgi:hypothetical protein
MNQEASRFAMSRRKKDERTAGQDGKSTNAVHTEQLVVHGRFQRGYSSSLDGIGGRSAGLDWVCFTVSAETLRRSVV